MDYKKGPVKSMKIFLKTKKKSDSMVANDRRKTKNNKGWLCIEKIIIKRGTIKTLQNKRLVLKMLD